MSEFRQNPISKQWVLISPNRGKRPEEFKTHSVMHGLPELDPNCVFCPGNEDKNPDLCENVCRIPDNNDWQVRVIANKYPVLEQAQGAKPHNDFYTSRAGYGDHEVIITRKHNEPVALQSISQVELSLHAFTDRINTMGKDEKIGYVEVFHNHGRDAGASLVHPHYQIISTPFVPPHLHSELSGCFHYFDVHRTCVYCDIIKEELKDRDRLVYESEHFVVVSPYASRKPFEMWILPKKHGARFENISLSEIKHLSFVLKATLGQLYTKLSDPPLNFYIHSMPFARSHHLTQEENSFHWHLIIFPRLTIWAGFEYSTGIPVNPVAPEEAASFLRGDL
jgi:UDPglucose--hexose-1-phosphate uridylyltransferase